MLSWAFCRVAASGHLDGVLLGLGLGHGLGSGLGTGPGLGFEEVLELGLGFRQSMVARGGAQAWAQAYERSPLSGLRSWLGLGSDLYRSAYRQ